MKLRLWVVAAGAAVVALAAGATVFVKGSRPPASLPEPSPPSSPEEALFDAHCGICHLQMGTGTITLARRLGPDHALLAERRDLDPDLVKLAVRKGIGNMPPQTRVDLSDAELDRIIAYLARPESQRVRAPPSPGANGHG